VSAVALGEFEHAPCGLDRRLRRRAGDVQAARHAGARRLLRGRRGSGVQEAVYPNRGWSIVRTIADRALTALPSTARLFQTPTQPSATAATIVVVVIQNRTARTCQRQQCFLRMSRTSFRRSAAAISKMIRVSPRQNQAKALRKVLLDEVLGR